MKDTFTSPDAAMASDRRPSAECLWRSLAVYAGCALAGGLLGREWYLPTPPAINEQVFFSDSRYAGAIVGAMVGAFVTVMLKPWLKRLSGSRVIRPAFLVIAGLLGWLLCDLNVVLGAATIVMLALPCVIAQCSLRARTAKDRGPDA